ncbi:hypothetical protein F5050DRAFT_1811589 [Lentinula boryana]|uniref:Uncharacterized protein n=1 Tax=Lentinula boryana TaxID=40481 RepID=A0ABQ8Q0U0_9AGAR|nr:hypothetical protein F5050DRAFT_1811589 [Lentinula boryana]
MFSTLSPYWNSSPRSDRVRDRVQVERSPSKFVGYSSSRFIILVVLGVVSFVSAAPLQPEPTPTATPSLVASTLKSSSSSSLLSSSLSSSPSTAIALTPSFVPRTNPEDSENSIHETFTVGFLNKTSNDNEFKFRALPGVRF